MSQYSKFPLSGGGITTYATFSAFPALAADGAAAIALDTDVLYVFNLLSLTWLPLGSPGSAVSIGDPANGLSLDVQALSIALADSSTTGALSGADFTSFNTVHGNPSSFAGFDPSTGLLSSIPGWSFNSDGTAGANIVYAVPAFDGGASLLNFDAEIQPTQDDPNFSVTGINFDFHLDRTGQNFNLGGDFVALNVYQSKEGSGVDGNQHALRIGQSLGNSTDGSVNDSGVTQFNANINPGLVANSYDFHYSRLQLDGDITHDTRFMAFDMNGAGAIHGSFQGYHLNTDIPVDQNVNMINLFSSNTVGQNYQGLNIDNGGAVAVDYNAANIFNDGAIGGRYTGYQQGNQGHVIGDFQALNINNQGAVDGNLSGYGLFLLGNSSGNIGGTVTALNIAINSGGGTIGGNITLIDVYSNVSPGASHGFQGMYISNGAGSPTYNNGISINLQGASQSTTGLSVNLDQVTGTNQINTAIQISGGGFQQNYDLTTANFTPDAEFQANSIGTQFTIAAGHPINAGQFGFLNNIGSTIIIEDDMGADTSGAGLGLSLNGFVGQIVAASGKTADTLNFMLAGASVPPLPGDGGTITNLSFFRAIGLLPAGGSLNVTNIYGFKVDALLSATSPANAWGVYVEDTNADNYFAKSVVVGGVTGKPTPTKAFDVTGDATVSGDIAAATMTPANGASGTFTTVDLKTVTVVNGIITSIV